MRVTNAIHCRHCLVSFMTYVDTFIESYVHNGGIGVLVELESSDSITIRSELFRLLAKDIAMHVAAMAPASIDELMQQPSVRDPGQSVSELIAAAERSLRAGIRPRRYVRWVANERETSPPPPRSPAVIHDIRKSG
jgi:elongation factor Ts